MKQKSGFTLIELLVVISIIAILAGLILVNMAGIRDRAKDTKTKSDLKQMKTALRMYYNDNNNYPNCASGATCACSTLATTLSNYIPSTSIPAGCTYEPLNSRDSFRTSVVLNSSAGTDDTNSATKCNAASTEGTYYECSE
ncbi:type II secretion system protein [Candidatus Woesebacteria bacterium]|nr:type II secretion system protein [Candidatus Woesebacteria bacterium]